MLETLGRTVKDECESEFIHSSDTAALLLRQMMQQVVYTIRLSAYII